MLPTPTTRSLLVSRFWFPSVFALASTMPVKHVSKKAKLEPKPDFHAGKSIPSSSQEGKRAPPRPGALLVEAVDASAGG